MPKTIKEIREKFINGSLKPSELLKYYLKNIREKDNKENGGVNAFLEVFEKEAREQAEIADAAYIPHLTSPNLGEGQSIPKKPRVLEGIPFAIKDCLMMQGHTVSAGSKMLENYISPYDSTVVKLLKENGAIIIGRTNMDEFALGGSGENSAYGKTLNPINNERVPGGTSSGSAAALAAEMCLIALGTDTGGSVRQPASFCGVVGYKPSYGKISRYGLIAAASSLDTVGIFANDVESIQYVLDIVGKEDEMDNTNIKNNFTIRKNAEETFKKYSEVFPEDKFNLKLLEEQLLEPENIFSRKNFKGHITNGALIINEKNEVLLIYHNILKKYFQPGGHTEEVDSLLINAGLREAIEETNIKHLEPFFITKDLGLPIFIEEQAIPENLKKDETSHFHHEHVWVFKTNSNEIKLDLNEVSDFKWIKLEEIENTDCGTAAKIASKRVLQILNGELKFENKKTQVKKIAYPKKFMEEGKGINEEVRKNFFESLEKLQKAGYEVVDLGIEDFNLYLAAYYIVNTAEVSSNMSRFDGLRYGGGDVGEIKNYGELFSKNRAKFFGKEVKRRIMLGTYVLSHGYYDAFYGKATKLREVMKEEFRKILKDAPLIIMPTAPTTAFTFGEDKDPITLYMEDIFTVPANLMGFPAISVPTGFDKDGLPFSLQVMGDFGNDDLVLDFAKKFESLK
jgi:Asp-tRNA(Asn)/Glu-tRNA(Gln) amidotransferase A subunit family amidase/8-oxo-dGTP pyrophosphatase MutT (NUDIX family)